jgi:threonine/homoserine/homoserine lactone efflux protein
VWDAVITECLQMALPRRKLLVRFGGEKPTFIAASVVLLLTPGPAVLYIVARSVEVFGGGTLLGPGALGDFLRRNRRFLRFQRWFAGTSFIGLGVTAALATRK